MPYLTAAEEIRSLITEYGKATTLWIDTEVADYKTPNPRLSLIQVLDHPEDMTGNSVYLLDVLDKSDVIADFVERIMTNDTIEKVFHNSCYDVKYLGGKKAKNITCTLEMARKIPVYLLPLPNYQLKTLATELCNFHHIDKQEQISDWGKRPLTEAQIEYAYLDCIYLAQVHLRLLDLKAEFNIEPIQEDLSLLTARYIEIEQQQKILKSEFEHLQERVKKAMLVQNISETLYCKLTSYERKTIKTQFQQLVDLIENQDIDLDFTITLTEDIRKNLGVNLEKLPLNVDTNTYWKITPKNQESQED
ncbi:ribonuclease D, partial [Dolichospermum sp. ST_con]|nr:ribonuclease D [Dolichospermum sp. ST_con]MDD1422401.1 ribonuclease D [Dolichospermum sp. ST_sed1]MDD1424548.1 ribonuclease D [Dolichospermum sp. ST_sed9]MDD1434371.1 ribonuclease D [Dolichospermum sp. ST_sed6]MDD1437930.1 ribonuclease D [Dolichospermum sp. ST_sed10]MDD1443738.1 ribonuclease D [Dolichospermum sp. ST_sed3]MDD1449305.1 ribonuclease D [Dolichospermum sp. ST_sed8]MDD1458030.1 ribonuclease D [Dolichospermum sp. ST_sed7]MDD1463312.1 ribonuclease D [Dolichospermum sp. ST_sed2]